MLSLFSSLYLLTIFVCLSGRSLKDISYEEIETNAKALAGKSATVKSASDLLGVPPARRDRFSCSPSIIRVTDTATLAVDSRRPQILISGEIHGDERVGPPSTLHTAQLLTWSADCEIHQIKEVCNQLDSLGGISRGQRLWLALLASRRDSFLVPTANCLGHKFRTRNDNAIDPNRDFPYSRTNNRCLMSTTAKIFDRLMQENLVQIVVTFHGGMVALGYEWGSKNHPKPQDGSPDDHSNQRLASALAEYGGSSDRMSQYPTGRINSIVYPVDGGMEDWLYAAGWDQGLVRGDCLGSTVAGVSSPPQAAGKRRLLLRSVGADGIGNSNASELLNTTQAVSQRDLTSSTKTIGEQNMASKLSGNRAIVFLAETSDDKAPSESTLGGTKELLNPHGAENGHIPRNIRLSLMAIDLLEPYTCFSQIQFSDSADSTASTSASSSSSVAHSVQSLLTLRWYVGGAQSVDRTFLTIHRLPNSAANQIASTSIWSQYLDSLPSDSVLDDLLLQQSHSSPNETSTSSTSSSGAMFDVSSHTARNRGSRHAPRLVSPVFSGRTRWHAGADRVSKKTTAVSEDEDVFQPNDPLTPLSDYVHPVNLSRIFAHRKRKLYTNEASSVGKNNNDNNNNNNNMNNNLHGPSSSAASSGTFLRGKYWIVAWAMVDQEYGAVGQGHPKDLGPMSYYANLRTNSASRCAATGSLARSCQGRRYWPSDFLELDVNDDGVLVHVRSVQHCAWWEYPLASSSVSDTGGGTHDRSPSSSSANADMNARREIPSPSLVDAVAESYSFERSYFFYFLVMLLAGLLCWHTASYWRRNRIYSTLVSNKYLNLPTGFQSLPQSRSTSSSNLVV